MRVYVIHVVIEHHLVLCILCTLPDTKDANYVLFYDQVDEGILNPPTTVIFYA
jgi:hypothetical protein